MPAVAYPLTVFYDGACGVCSREISHYRSIADERLQFVDIAAADFAAAAYGRSPAEFQARLHVRDGEGRFFTGVEAFRRLWEALPSPFYPLLAGLVGLPGIHLAARAGYALFARFRHLLPARHAASCPINGGRKSR
jgi:predicted DCC family thiol-disulfide oxidoreductase YuxK